MKFYRKKKKKVQPEEILERWNSRKWKEKSTQKNNYKLFREGGRYSCTGPFIGLSDVLGVLCRTPREYPRGRRWPTGAWVFRNWALLRHWQYHCIQLLWLWLQASPPPPSPHFSSLRCLLVVIALHRRRLPTGVQRILNELECFAACPSLLCALPRLPLLCFDLLCFCFACVAPNHRALSLSFPSPYQY